MARTKRWVVAVCVAAAVVGCAGRRLEYVEVKRIDEPLTEEEVAALLRIAQRLPGGKLPDFSGVFLPVPEWNPSRNLPVSELLEEQRQLLERRWSTQHMAQSLASNRPLARALRRERMTVEQFVGLALAVGTAMARSTLSPHEDLARLERKAEQVLSRLKKDNRPYSSLSKAGMYYVSQQAHWLTRLYRVRALKKVPPENVRLVRKHWEELCQIFPPQFASDPLAPLADPLEEKGVPFHELAESGNDDLLRWDPRHALVGHDVPDSQVAEQRPARPTPFRKPEADTKNNRPGSRSGNAG